MTNPKKVKKCNYRTCKLEPEITVIIKPTSGSKLKLETRTCRKHFKHVNIKDISAHFINNFLNQRSGGGK